MAVVLTILILAPMIGCQAQEEVVVGKEPVKIGFALATTGPFSYDGLLEAQALAIAVERINNAGGILGGRMVEGVVRDHGYATENAVTAVNKLIFDDKVDAIIGLEDTALIWAAEDIMHQAQIPYVEFGGNPPGWPEATDVGAFRIGFVMDQLVDGYFRYWVERGVKSMVVAAPDTTFIVDSYSEVFVPFAEQYGIELFPLITYPVGTPDFLPQLAKGAAYDADLFLGVNFFNSEIPREMTGMQELGVPLYAKLFDIPTEETIVQVVDAAEGVIIPSMTAFVYDDNPVMTDFREAYAAKTGLPAPHYWTSNAWMAFHALVYGMEAAGVTGKGDLAAIDAGIKAASWRNLQGDPVQWTENGAIVYENVILAQIQGGKFVKIGTIPAGLAPPNIYGEVLPPGTTDVGAKFPGE